MYLYWLLLQLWQLRIVFVVLNVFNIFDLNKINLYWKCRKHARCSVMFCNIARLILAVEFILTFLWEWTNWLKAVKSSTNPVLISSSYYDFFLGVFYYLSIYFLISIFVTAAWICILFYNNNNLFLYRFFILSYYCW